MILLLNQFLTHKSKCFDFLETKILLLIKEALSLYYFLKLKQTIDIAPIQGTMKLNAHDQ